MIGTFKSKALKRLWERNDARGVNPDHLPRVKRILVLLDTAENLEQLDIPGMYFHGLKGTDPTRYSLRVSANWRITFEWEDIIAERIDYEDYH